MIPFLEIRIEKILQMALPGEELRSPPEPVEGGNMNEVWRIKGKNSSYILKHAPPYIASAPEVSLDPGRMDMEAGMLRLFAKGGLLANISKPHVRPPTLYYHDPNNHLLLMEDVSPHRELDKLIYKQDICPEFGSTLGEFIGKLHRQSAGNLELAQKFDNQSIQQTRLEVQYGSAGQLLEQTGVEDYGALGKKAERVGQKYLTTGKCLIMGDLWPRSVLISGKGSSVRLIDWEFGHFGRPAQDVAHFAAHCWMLAHRASSPNKNREIQVIWENFIKTYTETLGSELEDLWNREEHGDAAVHFGCEILVRTVGGFQEGYLYRGLDYGSANVKEAVELAASSIRESEKEKFPFFRRNPFA